MKRIPILFSLTMAAAFIISSCSSDNTYAHELKVEKEAIKAYIKRQGINVLSSVPDKWGANDYVLTSDGLYFHLVSAGTGKDSLEASDKVVVRFKEYTLDEIPDTTINSWSTLAYPEPYTYTYGSTTSACTGFQEAFSYMKRMDAVAKIIVPSKIGFYYLNNDVTPYGYDIKIKIQK